MPYKKFKLRGQDLYKVINTETKEVKSEGSTLEDAKKQIRLLNSLEKKEKKGGSLKASQIKDAIELSYQGSKTTDAPKGYEIDKKLSDGRVKVYKDVNSPQTLVVHRGSSGLKDWLDNVRYGLTGQIKSTETFKKHAKKHQKALDKYGPENVIAIGHSRAGKYVEELNEDKPVKEVITYNKASGPSDLFRKNPKNQTDVRTDIDLVSALAPLQKHENKVVTIPSTSWNPLTAHSTTPLGKLGEKLLGKGFIGGSFNPKKLKVSEMRNFIKEFKKQNNEKWSGSKIGKKDLVKIFENEILNNENIDEMIGGNKWIDFVKQFSSRHSLKYACSLSKYKEPLRTAYKKFKEEKDWYEPLNLHPDTIGLKEPEQKMSGGARMYKPDFLPPLITKYETQLKKMTKAELIDEMESSEIEYDVSMTKNDLMKLLMENAGQEFGSRYHYSTDYPKCESTIRKAYECYGVNSEIKKELKGIQTSKKDAVKISEKIKQVQRRPVAINNKKMMREDKKELDDLIFLREKIVKNIKKKQENIRELDYMCQGVINELIKCEKYRVGRNSDDVIEDPVDWEERTRIRRVGDENMIGGNKWIDFVKNFASTYDTSYGCSLSDYRTKKAYKLFKEGKDWYIPRPSKVKFKDDDEINLIDVDVEDIEDRSLYNKCISRKKALSKLTNNQLKKKLIKLNPDAKNVKGTNEELINEILYLKKCYDLLDKNFKSLFSEPEEEEEEEEEYVFPEAKLKEEEEEEEEYEFPEAKKVNNVKDNVENISKKIEKLKQIGEEKGFVHFKPYTIVTNMAYINIISKYGGQCIVVNKDDDNNNNNNLNVGITINNLSNLTQSKIDEIGNTLKKCVDRGIEIIVIPLNLQFGKKRISHANLLIYKPFQRIIERFEPHGQQYGNSEKYDNVFNNKLRKLFEEDLKHILGDIYYKKPSDICPNKKGFQALESEIKNLKEEGGGFCSMWLLFLMEMIFLNPEKTTKEIIEIVLDITKSSPEYLKSLIRGYVIEIEDGLTELSKHLKFDVPFKFKDDPATIVSNLSNSKKKLYDWVLNIIFESEKYSKELPNYSPLPEKEIDEESSDEKIINEYIKKLKKLNKSQLNTMTTRVYGFTYPKKILKDDLISKYVNKLFENAYNDRGSIGLGDIDIILDKKLYEPGIQLPAGYLDVMNKIREFDKKSGGSKMSSKLSQGFAKFSDKLNPFTPALKNKKTRNLMTSSGDITRNYIVPALVEVGKPVAEASAMALSTAATGNPLLGKVVFDSLYNNMVSKKGYDPRQNQKSKELGKIASATGKVAELYFGKNL